MTRAIDRHPWIVTVPAVLLLGLLSGWVSGSGDGNAWFDAPDAAAQKDIGRQIQLQAFQDVPYLPVGQYFQATAYRRDITNVLKGLPLFWNVRRA